MAVVSNYRGSKLIAYARAKSGIYIWPAMREFPHEFPFGYLRGRQLAFGRVHYWLLRAP